MQTDISLQVCTKISHKSNAEVWWLRLRNLVEAAGVYVTRSFWRDSYACFHPLQHAVTLGLGLWKLNLRQRDVTSWTVRPKESTAIDEQTEKPSLELTSHHRLYEAE